MRRKDDTLRETLMGLAREIADAEGTDAISIRRLAAKAGVATGTVYNYFEGKDEILLALTEEYWKQTLLEMKTEITAESFCLQLREIFEYLRERIDQSAGRLMSSLGKTENPGQERMASMQAVLTAALVARMEQDKDIRGDIWDESFTKEKFARFVMVNMVTLLRLKEPDAELLITVIKRTIY